MEYCTPNQNGQITIPAKIRKANKINTDVVFEVFTQGELICLKPMRKGTTINYGNKKKWTPFVIKNDGAVENVSEKMDEILYGSNK